MKYAVIRTDRLADNFGMIAPEYWRENNVTVSRPWMVLEEIDFVERTLALSVHQCVGENDDDQNENGCCGFLGFCHACEPWGSGLAFCRKRQDLTPKCDRRLT
jgi:hypothetical protein